MHIKKSRNRAVGIKSASISAQTPSAEVYYRQLEPGLFFAGRFVFSYPGLNHQRSVGAVKLYGDGASHEAVSFLSRERSR